ncbi:helix-turn-helix domain-containing protein [Williamsia soli]|uniref:helix-turn-helix domain-containing protein n=1 Tax=Williamsia soli TaxID=364929 RepID=UPI001A9F0D81|nr:helix-turn-helix domain-containing protein [Williamsia soli]
MDVQHVSGPLPGVVATAREQVMAALLDDDPAVRRAAFAEAVSRRWIDRGVRTVVRAVVCGPGVEMPGVVEFGRLLASGAPTPTAFVRAVDGIIYLVSRDCRAGVDLDGWITEKAAKYRCDVLATGSAHHKPMSGDLGEAAEQARIAADLTAALPELQPSRSIDELGGWVLLNAIAADSRGLADFSPAAEWLRTMADPLQRRTIETYLDSGGQVRATCDRLHIHRTTLYYRLDNMPAIVRDALDDGMKRSTLHLTLKLIRLWESTGVL